MPAACFIRRLCWASQTLLRKLRVRRKSSDPRTDFTRPSCSCTGSRHHSRASPLTSFHGSWGETPATDEFLSGIAIGSPILRGDMCGLTAINSNTILSPSSSPNDRIYILVPEVNGFGSTDLSQPSHDLHMGRLRVVNPDPRTYFNQGLSFPSSLFSCSPSHRFLVSSNHFLPSGFAEYGHRQ